LVAAPQVALGPTARYLFNKIKVFGFAF
jgi:hypothetical protein